MTKHLIKSTSTVSAMTAISRSLGFVRDMVITQLFGASYGLDAFFVAFKLPNFMRALFAEGAFSQAFVPVLNEYKIQRKPEELKHLIDHTAGILTCVTTALTIVAIIAAPFIVFIFAPGFYLEDSIRFVMTTDMLRITFPYIIFISLAAFYAGILNSYHIFGPPAFTPVFLNLSLIVAALWGAPLFAQSEQALAYGVFVAGIIQLGFLSIYVKRIHLMPRLRFNFKDDGVRRILRLMLPAIFGVSVAQINLLVDTLFASFLPVGSVTWLYISDRMVFFPLGIIGTAIATVALPALAQSHASNQQQTYSQTIDWSLRINLLFGLPAAIGLFMLADSLLATLFQYNKFSAFDVVMASLSLKAFALGLVAFMVIKILASAFYARQNMKTPVRIGLLALAVNFILNVLLIKTYAHMGLALATTIAAIVNAVLLFAYLYKKQFYKPSAGWGKLLIQLAIASVAMIVLLYVITPEIDQWFEWTWQRRITQLLIIIIGAKIVYFTSLWVTGYRLADIKK